MVALRTFRLLGKTVKAGQPVKQWDKLRTRTQRVLVRERYVKESPHAEK